MSSQDNINASLELLLDTICNTFGGVLFISMLVVIMTNVTSKQTALTPPAETARESLSRAQDDLIANRRETLRSLRAALEQRTAIERQIADPETLRLMRRLHEQKARRAALKADDSRALEQAGQSQADVNRIAADIKQRDAALAAAKASLATTRTRLQSEITLRSRTARLPRLRETKKMELAFFLKQGRLTAYAVKSPDGSLVPNSPELLSTTVKGEVLLEPKPGAGLKIDPAGDPNGQIPGAFVNVEMSKHYVAIFVWPDSFEHFAPVRDALVRGQFEYRLVVLSKHDKVPVSSSTVRPMVQ